MNCCDRIDELLAHEREALRNALDEHKWYLSERAHQDVGYSFAQLDFLEKYIQDWGKKFRLNYCNDMCSGRENCEVRKEVAA